MTFFRVLMAFIKTSIVTQIIILQLDLVVGIAYGCPYYKNPAIFYLFCKVPQVKNCLFPTNPLPLRKALSCGQKICSAGEYLWLDVLKGADESYKFETELTSSMYSRLYSQSSYHQISKSIFHNVFFYPIAHYHSVHYLVEAVLVDMDCQG